MEAIHKVRTKGQKTAKDKIRHKVIRTQQVRTFKETHLEGPPPQDAECRSCHKKGTLPIEMQVSWRRPWHYYRGTDREQRRAGFSFAFAKQNIVFEMLHLNGEETVFKMDTRANVTAIPSSNYSIKKHGTLQPPRKVLYGPGNHRLEVKGCFKGELSIKRKTIEQYIYVVKGLSKPLLGLPAIKALKLIKRVHTVQVQQEDFKAQYSTVFSILRK